MQERYSTFAQFWINPNFKLDFFPVLRFRDVYPGSRILIFIPDLGSRIQKQQQKRGVKKIWRSHKFNKIEHYFSFEVLKKKL